MAYSLELSQTTVSTELAYIYGNEHLGQLFTTSGAFTATKVGMYFGRENSQLLASDPEIHIFSVSGGVPATSLGHATIEWESVNTDGEWHEGVLNTPVALSASTQYCVVIDPIRWSASSELLVYGNWPGSGGGFRKSTDDGVTWTPDARFNLGYRIYSGSDTTPVETSISGGFTGGGAIELWVATPEPVSIAGGFAGGGAIVLGVATPGLASIAGGFTGGGSIMLLGSSAWAGQHDTKQYVVAIGNGQVWICEV